MKKKSFKDRKFSVPADQVAEDNYKKEARSYSSEAAGFVRDRRGRTSYREAGGRTVTLTPESERALKTSMSVGMPPSDFKEDLVESKKKKAEFNRRSNQADQYQKVSEDSAKKERRSVLARRVISGTGAVAEYAVNLAPLPPGVGLATGAAIGLATGAGNSHFQRRAKRMQERGEAASNKEFSNRGKAKGIEGGWKNSNFLNKTDRDDYHYL